MSQIRLDKWLSEAGLGTRSEVKEYLKKGRVCVNGIPIKKPDTKISDIKDLVTFDGESVDRPSTAYYMFHKPAGCITAARDGKTCTVMDFFADAPEKDLAPVGRLDKDTEGFLLVTNDGLLNHFLLSPKRHVEKTYYALARGRLMEDAPQRFLKGISIGDKRPTLPAVLRILNSENDSTELLLTLGEGRYHQVKRMVQAVGGEVTYLKRISFGTIALDEHLKKGQYRKLTEKELEVLRAQARQTKEEFK